MTARRSQSLGAVAAAVAMLSLAGCGDEEPRCGADTCTAREYCDATAMPAECRCREAYTGEECALCALGYRETAGGDCEPVPIDCDADPGVCGVHGVCVSVEVGEGLPVDQCDCEIGWGGHVCMRCDDGWQDNDMDGSCRPGCELAELTCAAPLSCSDRDGVALCACPLGYAGDGCDLCARGYQDNDNNGSCMATCTVAALVCGDRQVCNDSGGTAACACIEGYTGDGCTACASGYQDHARPGDCRPSCSMVDLVCGTHGACDDASGIAHCACDDGFVGAGCDSCASGYDGELCNHCTSSWARVGDAACMPTCSSGALGCSSAAHCWDGPTGVESACVCSIGYMGDTCTACATGFTADGSGHCVARAPSGHTLLAIASMQGETALAALNPTTGAIFPLRSAAVTDVAFDPGSRAVYAIDGNSIVRLDFATGMPLSMLATGLYSPVGLTFDSSRRALFTVENDGITLKRIDVASGVVTTVTDSLDVPYLSGLAFDAMGNRLLFVQTWGSSPTVGAIDPTTGVVTPIGSVTAPITGIRNIGIGVEPTTSTVYLSGNRQLTQQQELERDCRLAARRLGLGDYDAAPASGTFGTGVAPGATQSLRSTRTSGHEIVVYGAYGDRSAAVGTLRIETTNPEALVCIATYEQHLRVQVAATARFAGIAVETHYPNLLSAAVDTGFPAPSSPTVHMGGYSESGLPPDPSLMAYPAVVRFYDNSEWNDRRLNGLYPSGDAGDGMLVAIDRATGAVTRTVDLPGTQLQRGLAPWSP